MYAIAFAASYWSTILRAGQLSDADRVAPKHSRRDVSWIVAGMENADPSRGRDVAQQTFRNRCLSQPV